MPKGRLTMAAAGVAMLGVPGAPLLAQGSLPDQLQVCARISSKSARLECYDSVAAAARQGTSASGFGASSIREPQGTPPPPPPPPGTAGAAGAAGAAFGAEQLPRAAGPSRGDAQNEMEIAVTSARDNGLDMWQFTLADGAVWRMTERVANFRPPAPNETVKLMRGALGGYLLRVGGQQSVRVERVR